MSLLIEIVNIYGYKLNIELKINKNKKSNINCWIMIVGTRKL